MKSRAGFVATLCACAILPCGFANEPSELCWNVTDEMIMAVAAKGGVIQINYLYLDQARDAESQGRQTALAKLRADRGTPHGKGAL
jgi:hypothetical protein